MEATEAIRRLEAAKTALEKIVCTEGDDAGVILVSADSSYYFDAEAGVSCYHNEFFSPLGDALIGLHRILEGTDGP